MDLISRDSVLDMAIPFYKYDGEKVMAVSYDDIKNIPSEFGWKDYSKEKPSSFDKYIIMTKFGYIDLDYWIDIEGGYRWKYNKDNCIIAWTKFPTALNFKEI